MSDPRIRRQRHEDLLAATDRLSTRAENGGVAILAQTTAASAYPTVAGAFFACVPLWIDGPEVEGAAASFTADPTRATYAYNLGTAVPPLNTRVILHACGGRWTFRYDG